MDVREIEFTKCFRDIHMDNNYGWKALGFYDYISVARIKDEDFQKKGMAALFQETENSILRLDGTYDVKRLLVFSKDDVKDFWEDDAPILTVTLLYFKASIKSDSISTAATSNIPKETYPHSKFACYRSMDGCDAVVFGKSNTYSELMKFVIDLYKKGNLDYAFTVPGFSKAIISDKNSLPLEGTAEIVLEKRIESLDKTDAYFTAVTDHFESKSVPIAVAGNNDFYIDLGSCPVQKLVEFCRKCEANPVYGVTTRLGFNIELDNGDTSSSSKKLPLLQEQWVERLDEMKALSEKGVFLSNTFTLVNATIQLASARCAKDVFYQIAPAVSTFLDLACKSFKNGGKDDRKDDEETAFRFLRGWNSLIQQALGADAQLVQIPICSAQPIQYPSKLAVFYTSLCYEISEAYQWEDKKKLKYAYFLVSKLCRKVKFSFVFQSIGHESRLAYVDIPYHQLYTPKVMMISLAHEVAHIAGDVTRQREARFKAFVDVLAFEIIDLLGLVDNDDTLKIIKKIALKEPRVFTKGFYYLSKVKDYLKGLCKDFPINDAEIIELLLSSNEVYKEQEAELHKTKDLSECVKVRTQMSIELDKIRARLSSISEDVLNHQIEKTAVLFRETYADVAMIQQLGISFDDYIEAFCVVEGCKTFEELDACLPRARVLAVRQVFEEKWRSNKVSTMAQNYNDMLNSQFTEIEITARGFGRLVNYLKECTKLMKPYDKFLELYKNMTGGSGTMNMFHSMDKLLDLQKKRALDYKSKKYYFLDKPRNSHLKLVRR